MAHLTIGAAKAAAVQQGVRSTKVAKAQFRIAAGAPLTTTYDVFLSHSFMDADTIAGIAAILEAEGQRVYVDWIEDPQADREPRDVEYREDAPRAHAKIQFADLREFSSVAQFEVDALGAWLFRWVSAWPCCDPAPGSDGWWQLQPSGISRSVSMH
jgi:hypothetical protein